MFRLKQKSTEIFVSNNKQSRWRERTGKLTKGALRSPSSQKEVMAGEVTAQTYRRGKELLMAIFKMFVSQRGQPVPAAPATWDE